MSTLTKKQPLLGGHRCNGMWGGHARGNRVRDRNLGAEALGMGGFKGLRDEVIALITLIPIGGGTKVRTFSPVDYLPT